ncbi:MAG: NTP transferase domain-containing protein [Candidatus Dormibacteraceae bacterium]
MMISNLALWIVVLIKEFSQAKQRLGPALAPEQRCELAGQNARLALQAAAVGDRVLAVCGGPDAADLAAAAGADEVILEPIAEGQNQAARRGIEHVLAARGSAVLLLSSDLPLITEAAVAELLAAAVELDSPAVLAAPAIGRGGTNALYLSPPDVIDLHFGHDSLTKFRYEAEQRGIRFALHEAQELALDLDQPSDLALLAEIEG